jgi:RNA recognition motif-containing protein
MAINPSVPKIYVGNLPYGVTEAELKEEFGRFGAIREVRIIKDRGTGLSKGFGFIEFERVGDAGAAIEAMDEFEFRGRNLRVNEALPPRPRT